jgi:hypothetical protein
VIYILKIGYKIITKYEIDPVAISVYRWEKENFISSNIFETEPTLNEITAERERVKEQLKDNFKKYFENITIQESWIKKVFYES